MNGWELHEQVQAGLRPVVECTKDGANLETVLNEGMRAKIVNTVIRHNGEVLEVHCDLNSFDGYNRKHEHANYWNKDHTLANLTARESGWYPKNGIETMYIMLNDPVTEFTFLDSDVLVDKNVMEEWLPEHEEDVGC